MCLIPIPFFTHLISEIEEKLGDFVRKENIGVLLALSHIDEDNIDKNIKAWEQAFRDVRTIYYAYNISDIVL
jgi:hydrogenase maturation factor